MKTLFFTLALFLCNAVYAGDPSEIIHPTWWNGVVTARPGQTVGLIQSSIYDNEANRYYQSPAPLKGRHEVWVRVVGRVPLGTEFSFNRGNDAGGPRLKEELVLLNPSDVWTKNAHYNVTFWGDDQYTPNVRHPWSVCWQMFRIDPVDDYSGNMWVNFRLDANTMFYPLIWRNGKAVPAYYFNGLMHRITKAWRVTLPADAEPGSYPYTVIVFNEEARALAEQVVDNTEGDWIMKPEVRPALEQAGLWASYDGELLIR